ncbi:MAG: archease [Candidatus Pacearchaeota archaeon]
MYRFLEHSADICFEVSSKKLEGLFVDAAKAIKKILTEKKVKEKKNKRIKIKAKSLEELLYLFLEEIIYLTEVDFFIISSVKKIKIDKENFVLESEIYGDDIKEYKIERAIKAVTYHSMKIEKKEGVWRTKVILDL